MLADEFAWEFGHKNACAYIYKFAIVRSFMLMTNFLMLTVTCFS